LEFGSWDLILLVSSHDPVLPEFGKEGVTADGRHLFPFSHPANFDEATLAKSELNRPSDEAFFGIANKDQISVSIRMNGIFGDDESAGFLANENATDAEVIRPKPAVGIVDFRMDSDAPCFFIHFRADVAQFGRNGWKI
jgi:hypothetical protein